MLHAHIKMNDEDWISISDAAKRLGVERSSLSRYVKKFGLKTKKHGRSRLIHFSSLDKHRQENIRIEQREVSEIFDNQAVVTETNQAIVTNAERRAAAQATLAEIEVAKAQGKLIEVSSVDKTSREAVVLMMAAFEKAVEQKSAEGAIKYQWDERLLRIFLKEFSNVGLREFHSQIQKLWSNVEDCMTNGDREYLEPQVQKILQ